MLGHCGLRRSPANLSSNAVDGRPPNVLQRMKPPGSRFALPRAFAIEYWRMADTGSPSRNSAAFPPGIRHWRGVTRAAAGSL